MHKRKVIAGAAILAVAVFILGIGAADRLGSIYLCEMLHKRPDSGPQTIITCDDDADKYFLIGSVIGAGGILIMIYGLRELSLVSLSLKK